MSGHPYSISRRFAVALLACFAWQFLGNPLAAAEKVDPDNCVWAIRLTEMFEKNPTAGPRIYQGNLNIYAVFEKGKFSHALGSAQRFNKSYHLVEEADIRRDGKKVQGKLKLLMCPDVWVPLDHRPVKLDAEFDGITTPVTDRKGNQTFELTGNWKAVMHGSRNGPGPDTFYQGVLTGGGNPVETGWDQARLRLQMTPSPAPGEPVEAMLDLSVSVSGGKVTGAAVGTNWMQGTSPWRQVPLDDSGLSMEGPIIHGKAVVPYRAISIGCDPRAQAELDMTICRVQNIVGGRALVTPTLDGRAYRPAYLACGGGQATRSQAEPALAQAPKPLWAKSVNLAPAYVPVAGFTPVAPGEHPRLLFRKTDLSSLRQKAETPDGKAILCRLRRLLDGKNGDTVPTVFNATPPNNHNTSPVLPEGAFTTWHAAGYGFLYQITGDKKYADLARQAVQWCFDGKIDIDNRYVWNRPGTGMRAGSILAGVAYAYDFCYDAWTDDFRKKVALEIQNYKKRCAGDDGNSNETVDLERLSCCAGYPPGSNHYGAYLGTGVAILGILGDPGTDAERLAKCLRWNEKGLLHLLNEGFGDHGFFPEGHHASRVSANCGGEEFLMALPQRRGPRLHHTPAQRPMAHAPLDHGIGALGRGSDIPSPRRLWRRRIRRRPHVFARRRIRLRLRYGRCQVSAGAVVDVRQRHQAFVSRLRGRRLSPSGSVRLPQLADGRAAGQPGDGVAQNGGRHDPRVLLSPQPLAGRQRRRGHQPAGYRTEGLLRASRARARGTRRIRLGAWSPRTDGLALGHARGPRNLARRFQRAFDVYGRSN